MYKTLTGKKSVSSMTTSWCKRPKLNNVEVFIFVQILSKPLYPDKNSRIHHISIGITCSIKSGSQWKNSFRYLSTILPSYQQNVNQNSSIIPIKFSLNSKINFKIIFPKTKSMLLSYNPSI